MRQTNFEDKQFDFIKKLLENDEVQKIGMNMSEDYFVFAYETFHKKKPVKR